MFQFANKFSAVIWVLYLCFQSQITLATEKTYLQCYGIKNSKSEFLMRSQLLDKTWALNPKDTHLELQGNWNSSKFTDVKENFFVASHVGGQHFISEKVHGKLKTFCQNSLQKSTDIRFEKIRYYASNSVAGYEYPVLTEQESREIIDAKDFSVNTDQLLRYAFASAKAYALKKPEELEKYSSLDKFKTLMDEETVKVIDEHKTSMLHAIAIQVPSVSSGGNELEEEVIVAFKGTDKESSTDLLSDFAIASESINFFGTSSYRLALYQEAFEFLTKIINQYPPKDVLPGYDNFPGATKHRVVLTGHSLGGYIAGDLAVRTGLPARTFSSPSLYIIRDSDQTSANMFANTMPMGNVINIYLEGDPIVEYSGRYSENRLMYSPLNNPQSVLDNHKLTNVIAAISSTEKPTYVSLTPDSMMGFGLGGARVNINRPF